jgi:GntR family transcriptional regulator
MTEPQVDGAPGDATERSEAGGRVAEDVRRRLLEDVRSGRLNPGERLPGERELALHYRVSRASVRAALSALQSSGVVRRVPGRGGGTFITAPKIERDLSKVVGVPAYLRQQGLTAGTRVLSTGMHVVDAATANAFGLASSHYVFDIVRIRLADGWPFSLEQARFPADLLPGFLELPLGGSLYELLEERYGLTPARAVEHIEVVAANPDEAGILGVDAGDALLSITRTAWAPDGQPFEYSHDLFRADRTRITVHTQGGPGSDGGTGLQIQAQPAG